MNPLTIIALIDAAARLVSIINTEVARARERGELTPEQEADLDARIAALRTVPAWQPKDPAPDPAA